MGLPLPKPVMTQLQERYGNPIFRCGSSCVNGYRDSMEDAHLAYLEPTWGFFGVFDGHVNDQCSTYLEGAWRSKLDLEKSSRTIPLSDERLRELALQVDQEWMDSDRDGGSTGTFFLAYHQGDKVQLQVGNVGDSRVVACIDGVCHPLTEDHKPNNEGERQRIESCGGHVDNNRVDGNLAVSRAFGDRDYKQGSGPQTQQKVIALADVTHATVSFDKSDFVTLCCDGVFEGNFSNEEVIEFIKEQLKTCDDLAEIAGRVCAEAIERGSRDNISCVIVQFTNGTSFATTPPMQIVPGPFSAARNSTFRKVYEMMAVKGHSTVGAVLEQRYDALAAKAERSQEEQDELAFFNEGPPANLARGSEARLRWFTELFQSFATAAGSQSEHMERIQYLQNHVNVPLPILLSLINDSEQ